MDPDNEKATVQHVSSAGSVGLVQTQSGEEEVVFTPEEERQIIWKIDRRLVVTVGFMYCISLMDRTNLGSAAIAGMLTDLKLVGNRYSVVTLVFFTTYVVCQPPSTVIVRKIGPRIHMSLITLLWGALMIGMGFAPTYEALAALRVVLGILEAGYFPSVVYLLSTWYTRYEIGKRYSVFYIIGCVASAFAGILAFGLWHMAGLQGLGGWRWIFIIEGLLTCLIAIAGYWLLVDFPDSKRTSWKFLNDAERAWVIARVNKDRGDAKLHRFELLKFLRPGLDFKVWCYAMLFFDTTTITYALAYFLPLILTQNLHFDTGTSQILVAPPYVLAGIVMYTTGWLSDKYRVRGPIIVFNMVLCIIGLAIMGWHTNPGVRYFGIFLTTAGANSNVPAVLSYQANNIRGQWKRAFCSATLVGFGGIGGIAGSLVFRSQDEQDGYKPGLYACMACCILSILIICLVDTVFYFQNRKADRGEKTLESYDGDHDPRFRYTF